MSILSESSSTTGNDNLKAVCSETRSRISCHNNVREASFSSYLTEAEETFVRSLTHPARRSQDHEQSVPRKTKGEIGVFAAEKYFSGEMDAYFESPRSTAQINSVASRETISASDLLKRRAFTRSLVSESSSDSRSILLQNAVDRNNDLSTSKKGKKAKSFLSKLRCKCKCSCTGGDSIDVDETATGWGFADEVFSFPTMGSIPRTLKQQEEEEEIPRESLEVFGSSIWQKRKKSSSIKLKKHTESDSDVSSELFEIESATENSKEKTFLARQDLKGPSSSRYAPSEASVEWSVVTASAADFSEYYEETKPPTFVSIGSPVYKKILITKANKEARHLSHALLGCKNLRSVEVSGDSHKVTNPRLDFESDKQRDFEWRNRVSASPRLLLQSPSPRASRFLC